MIKKIPVLGILALLILATLVSAETTITTKITLRVYKDLTENITIEYMGQKWSRDPTGYFDENVTFIVNTTEFLPLLEAIKVMSENLNMTPKLIKCMERNEEWASLQVRCKELINVKDNLTLCEQKFHNLSIEKEKIRSELQFCLEEKTKYEEKANKVEGEKNLKYLFGIIGFIIGAVAIYFYERQKRKIGAGEVPKQLGAFSPR